ncbi:hypothetical protein EOM81_12400 [bacterium]|nr:hypothetical protein [bacterium]
MEKIITFEDFKPEQRDIKMFVGLDGNAYADEFAAKYASCTHRKCEKCGKPTEKRYVMCASCALAHKKAEYEKLPKKEWKGEPLYSEFLDEYFFDDDLENYYTDCDETIRAEDLRLVFCEPEPLPQIQIENWDLYEDYEVSKEVEDAVKALNELLAKQPPHCWYPGKVAAIVNFKKKDGAK